MTQISKLYERRRLRKLEAYHKGFIGALLLCEQNYGSDDFIELQIDEHKDKLHDIQNRLRNLPADPDEKSTDNES